MYITIESPLQPIPRGAFQVIVIVRTPPLSSHHAASSHSRDWQTGITLPPRLSLCPWTSFRVLSCLGTFIIHSSFLRSLHPHSPFISTPVQTMATTNGFSTAANRVTRMVLCAGQLTHQTPWSRSASSAGPRSRSRLPLRSLYTFGG